MFDPQPVPLYILWRNPSFPHQKLADHRQQIIRRTRLIHPVQIPHHNTGKIPGPADQIRITKLQLLLQDPVGKPPVKCLRLRLRQLQHQLRCIIVQPAKLQI